eukprot:scaffold55459_cov30-Tisochrysis_lutea.AAC.4
MHFERRGFPLHAWLPVAIAAADWQRCQNDWSVSDCPTNWQRSAILDPCAQRWRGFGKPNRMSHLSHILTMDEGRDGAQEGKQGGRGDLSALPRMVWP